jgi:hypothetical protein
VGVKVRHALLRRATETTLGRVLLLLSAVAVVLLGSAALAYLAFDEYGSFGAALWSAVLHVLDPSSLQDDEGAAQRAIGLFQVIAGLVLLVGLLFTFVAESFANSLERLGQSDRPVRARDHLLVIGGVDLVPVAVRAAAKASRSRIGTEIERVVVLAPESARESRGQLRAELKEAAGDLRIDLVFGDTAGDSGFELVAAEEARAVLLMPSTSGPVVAEAADVEVTQGGLALLDYLSEREATPLVRLLFRRGRNVDASWELFPREWDAIVGDRTVSAVLRLALSKPRTLETLPGWTGKHEANAGFVKLVDAAWAAAAAENRRLRLTIVGCGINAPALMEDLAQLGTERFELTMIAAREAFDAYLGSSEPSGVSIRFVDARPTDPAEARDRLAESAPDLVLTTPSPAGWDPRASDASATLAVLHVLRTVGPETPVLAELLLPDTARRLPADPRLLAISGLSTVATGVALSLFDPQLGAELERQLAADGDDR